MIFLFLLGHGIRINQIVSSVFILTTRIVFCSTNVLSVAALNATTSISARHNILSSRTSASYTVTFEAVATDELQECLWCRLLVHPVNGYVTVNHIPAMTMWTWRMSCRFQGILPNAGLVICSATWYLRASLVCGKLQVCVSLLQNSLYRTIRLVSVQ